MPCSLITIISPSPSERYFPNAISNVGVTQYAEAETQYALTHWAIDSGCSFSEQHAESV